jgi:hypothetical protein
MLLVEVCLASYTLGDFKISYFKMGPTELRILLSIGNLALLWKSMAHLAGRAYRLFDIGGTIGIAGMLLILVMSVIQNSVKLYRREPLPVQPVQRNEARTAPCPPPATSFARGIFGASQRWAGLDRELNESRRNAD